MPMPIIAALVGVLVGWLLGLGTDALKHRLFGPRFAFAFSRERGSDMLFIPADSGLFEFRLFFSRLRIQNVGRTAAETCRSDPEASREARRHDQGL